MRPPDVEQLEREFIAAAVELNRMQPIDAHYYPHRDKAKIAIMEARMRYSAALNALLARIRDDRHR